MRPEILRRGPLDGVTLPQTPGVSVALQPFALRFILRGEAPALGAVHSAFGVALPTAPLSSATEGARSALWLGPDEWMLIAEDDSQGLESGLETALSGVFHSLVDISHRQTALAVEGPRAWQALNFGVALDLDLAAFPVGQVVRTLFVKAEVTLWRQGAQNWRIEVARSFSSYVADALAVALSSLP